MKAAWNAQTIAESPKTVIVDGHHYFPHELVHMDSVRKSGNQYQSALKGFAPADVVVHDGQTNHHAAWMYLKPSASVKQIKGHVAFG